MNFTYTITGMTCEGCSAKVKGAILKHPDVLSAEVSHQDGRAQVQADSKPNRNRLDRLLADAGDYHITDVSESSTSEEKSHSHVSSISEQETLSVWETYKPLVLIFLFVSGIAAIAAFDAQTFSWHHWMRYFMAGFFIVFSFFKFLDLKGFARSYAMYDLLAKQW